MIGGHKGGIDLRTDVVVSFAKWIVEEAARHGLTAEELKYACGWASGAPNKRVEAVPVIPEDAEAINRDD